MNLIQFLSDSALVLPFQNFFHLHAATHLGGCVVWTVGLSLVGSRHRVAARCLLLAALGWTALVGWLQLPEALLRELENRHPAPVEVAAGQLQAYTGVVVLGESPERLKASVTLLRQHPHLRLLFTGGDGKWWASGPTEADQAEAFYKRMGVPADRLPYERTSRTTYENAVLGAVVPGVDVAQPWLLLTSARHMPRALAVFRAAGWHMAPYPVDYRRVGFSRWSDYSLARGAVRWQLVLHEAMGLAAFAAVGLADF